MLATSAHGEKRNEKAQKKAASLVVVFVKKQEWVSVSTIHGIAVLNLSHKTTPTTTVHYSTTKSCSTIFFFIDFYANKLVSKRILYVVVSSSAYLEWSVRSDREQ